MQSMPGVFGTLASSTARAGTSYEMIRQKTKSTSSPFLDLFSIPNFYIRKGRPHGHRYGKKEGAREYHTANQLQKKCRKRGYLNIHDRFTRDTWFRKTMLELDRTEEVIREMDKLANEDHTHICHRRRTQRVSWQLVDTFEFCGFRHDADKASPWLQTSVVNLASPQESRGWSLLPKYVAKLFLIVVWQDSWWHPSPETSPRRWTWHWSNGETWEISETSIYVWHESHNEFGAKLTVINSVRANAVHCHRRGV